MSAAVTVQSLSKQYKDVCAVDNVSFEVEVGHCFGLLGPNGAGKTTTIEIMEGIISASSGEVLYQGHPVDSQTSQQIGIQFQHTRSTRFFNG